MNTRNNSYWEARTNAIMDKQQLNADITYRKLRKAYIKAILEIETDVRKIYNKLKKNGELNDDQVKEFLNTELSKLDRKQLKKLILNTKDDKLRKFLIVKLDAPAYVARIARKEAIKVTLMDNLNQIMNEVAVNEIILDKNLFIQNMNESYYAHMWEVQRGMQIGFDVGALSKKTIEAILRRPFAGGYYSERIWENTSRLADQLYETIVSGLLNGKPLKRMINELTETMGVGESAARRLIRTESAYYTNMAAIQGYKECGIEKYRYYAKLDLKVSKICRELDGKIFPISEAQTGVNLPPMHPWCRSSIGPVIDGGVAQRIGVRTRDVVTGESHVIKGDITYKEWYDRFVVDKHGKDKAEALEKMIKNKSSDRKQHKRYVKELKGIVPKKLENFQEMKYTNKEEWERLSYQYKLKTVYNLDKLKHTENFASKDAIRHILEGEINRRGKAVGFHMENIPTKKGRVIERTRSLKDKNGVYSASVEIDGILKDARSSFFPTNMLPQQIIQAINEAYNSREPYYNSMLKGKTSYGFEVGMYLDKNNKISSAFPIQKRGD